MDLQQSCSDSEMGDAVAASNDVILLCRIAEERMVNRETTRNIQADLTKYAS